MDSRLLKFIAPICIAMGALGCDETPPPVAVLSGTIVGPEAAETSFVTDVAPQPIPESPTTSDTFSPQSDPIPDLDATFDFFTPPEPSLPLDVIDEGDEEHIRLIGFIDSTSAADSKIALLKVGERLVFLRDGEQFEGIELLSISDRRITLQRKGRRWTLALLDQPIVHKTDSNARHGHLSSRRRDSSSKSESTRRSAPRFPDPIQTPTFPMALPDLAPPPEPVSAPANLPVPSIPQLPSLFDRD